MNRSRSGLLKLMLFLVLAGLSSIPFFPAGQPSALSSTPSNIVVVPDSIVDSLCTGGTQSQTLTIHNTGDSPLVWDLTIFKVDSSNLFGLKIMWASSHGQYVPVNYTTIISQLTARGASVIEEFRSLNTSVLNEYDIIWSKDIQTAWSSSEQTDVNSWLNNGGRLLLEIDDNLSIQTFNNLLWRIGAPFFYTSMYSSHGFTTAIHPHETTVGVDSIYLNSSKAQLANIEDSSRILIEYPNGLTNAAYCEASNYRLIALADETFYNPGIPGLDSDNLLFGNQVFNWLGDVVNWAVASPTSGTIPAYDSAVVDIEMNAVGRPAGGYIAGIRILTNSPADSMVSVPLHMYVSDAPDIEISETELSYGMVALQTFADDTLVISNVGTEILNVNDITTDNPDFSVDITSFSLTPGDTQAVIIRLTPSIAGPIQGTLTIMNDDPDESMLTVSLTGESNEFPLIDVLPDSLSATLYSRRISTQWLMVQNPSLGSQLTCFFSSVPGGSGSIKILYDRAHGQNSMSNRSILVSDLISNDFILEENFSTLTPELLASCNILWTIEMSSDWTGSERTTIEDWVRAGGALLLIGDEGTSINSYNQLLHDLGAGIEFSSTPGDNGITTNIYPHSMTEGVSSINILATHARLRTVASPAARLVSDINDVPNTACSIVGEGRLVAVADELFYDGAIQTADNRLFGSRIFGWLTKGQDSWLSVSPAMDIVDPSSSRPVSITFDAGTLAGGEYASHVLITSDAFNAPLLFVPVRLTVIDAPNIFVEDSVVAFDPVSLGASETRILDIINTGQETLIISNIQSSHPDYTVLPTSSSLLPGENLPLEVTFEPGGLGINLAALTILSNDPVVDTLIVQLQGEGVPPPEIAATPDSLSADLFTGEVSSRLLTISNTGGNVLSWHLTAEADTTASRRALAGQAALSWLTAQPDSGDVPPDSSMDVSMIFDAHDLDGGDYYGRVDISSNDLDDSLTVIPVHLHVDPAPDIVLSDTSIYFNRIFIGQIQHYELIVSNVGNDTLRVNDIESNNPNYSADITTFNVPPGGERTLTVRFSPLDEGEINGRLTILTNDFDEDSTLVWLHGEGMLSPEIVASADSVLAALLPGEASRQHLTIANSGGTDLCLFIILSSSANPQDSLQFARFKAEDGPGIAPGEETGQCNSVLPAAGAGQNEPTWVAPVVNERIRTRMLSASPVVSLDSASMFADNFEDGNYAGWVDDGGASLKEVTALTAANGSVFSYHEYNSQHGHNDGIYRVFHAMAPRYISFWVRSGDTQDADAYFSLRDSQGQSVLLFIADPTGHFWVNAYDGGSRSFVYSADTWYHIEFWNVDSQGQYFDYFVDGNLVKGGVPFLWAGGIDDLYSIELYNYSAGSEAWWDEIYISEETAIDWLKATPGSAVVPPDGSIDIALDFDAAGLPAGEYDGVINIQSNDPDKPNVMIPVWLLVDSALTRSIALTLESGWNLISWNTDTAGDSVSTLLAAIMNKLGVVHGFGAGGLTFAPDVPAEFNTLHLIDHYQGCMVRMDGPDTVHINGSRVQVQEPISIRPGYNLIGYLPDLPDSIGHALESVLPNTELVLGYDGAWRTFDPLLDPGSNTLRSMEPGRGYWLKSSDSDDLIYPRLPISDPLLLSAMPVAESIAAQNDLTPTTEWISVWGDSVSWGNELLGIGTVIQALDPDGVVCGEFVVYAEGSFGMMPVYRNDPYTSEDEGAEPGDVIRFLFGQVGSNKTITWTANGDVVDYGLVETGIEGGTPFVPTFYRLSQNYPNPFNPTTTIEYELPKRTTVRLSIFNVNGVLVRELVNRKQPPDRYRIKWDGQNESGQVVSSGIYFYRLQAGDFTQTKKMVFLK